MNKLTIVLFFCLSFGLQAQDEKYSCTRIIEKPKCTKKEVIIKYRTKYKTVYKTKYKIIYKTKYKTKVKNKLIFNTKLVYREPKKNMFKLYVGRADTDASYNVETKAAKFKKGTVFGIGYQRRISLNNTVELNYLSNDTLIFGLGLGF